MQHPKKSHFSKNLYLYFICLLRIKEKFITANFYNKMPLLVNLTESKLVIHALLRYSGLLQHPRWITSFAMKHYLKLNLVRPNKAVLKNGRQNFRVENSHDVWQSINLILLVSIWVKGSKNGPSKICGRQLLKNLMWYGLLIQITSPQIFPQLLLGPFLNILAHLFWT